MLSTFCSLLAAIIVAVVVYFILDTLFEFYVAKKIYNASMLIAENYLLDNGRGFFEDKNKEAINAEWVVRLVLTLFYYVIFVLLAIFLIPFGYKIWLVTGLAIKLGVIGGMIVNFAITEIVQLLHTAHIGRLTEIQDDGVGHFSGVYDDDFEVDLSMWDNPEERPPLDKKYIVLDIFGNKGFAMLDIF